MALGTATKTITIIINAADRSAQILSRAQRNVDALARSADVTAVQNSVRMSAALQRESQAVQRATDAYHNFRATQAQVNTLRNRAGSAQLAVQAAAPTVQPQFNPQTFQFSQPTQKALDDYKKLQNASQVASDAAITGELRLQRARQTTHNSFAALSTQRQRIVDLGLQQTQNQIAAEERLASAQRRRAAAVAISIGVGALGGVAIAKSAIGDTTKYVEEVRRLGAETGVTAEQASTLIFQTRQMGVDETRLFPIIAQFIRRIGSVGEAEDGVSARSKTVIDALQLFGVATVDSKNNLLPFLTVLDNMRHKFQELPNGIEKTAFAEQIFSRGGGTGGDLGAFITFLSASDEDMKKMAETAKKTGVVIDSEFVQKFLVFQQASKAAQSALLGIELVIASVLLPYLIQFSNWFTANGPAIRRFAETATRDIVRMAQDFLTGFKTIYNAIDSVVKLLDIFPNHSNVTIAAMAAIGAAMIVLATGPVGTLIIALGAVVALLGEVANRNHDLNKSSLPGLYKQQESLQRQLGLGRGEEFAGGELPTDSKSLDLLDQLKKVNQAIEVGEAREPNRGPFSPYGNLGTPPISPIGQIGNIAPDAPSSAAEKVDQYLKMIDDAMEDGIVTYKEYINILQQAKKQGVDPLTVAEVALKEADYRLADGNIAARTAAYDLEKAQVKLTYAAKQGADAFNIIASDIIDQQLEMVDAAHTALTKNMTVEEARLKLQMASTEELLAMEKQAADPIIESRKRYITQLGLEKDAVDAAYDAQKGQLDIQKKLLDLQKAPENTQHFVARRFKQETDNWQKLHDAAGLALDNQQSVLDAVHTDRQKQIDNQVKLQQKANDDQFQQVEALSHTLGMANDILTAHHAVQEAQFDFDNQALITEKQRDEAFQKLDDAYLAVTSNFVDIHGSQTDQVIVLYGRNIKALGDYNDAIYAAIATLPKPETSSSRSAGDMTTASANPVRYS